MKNIIEFKGVTKKYGEKTAIDDVTFTVEKGDIFGYLGPNGSGKTTSIRMMLDLLHVSSGEILLFGKPIGKNDIRKKIGICLDDEGFYPELTAYQNLEYFDRIYNDASGRKKRIDEFIDRVGLSNSNSELVGNFSKGMKRRLGIARALLNNPELLILDEPTNGLDPDGQKYVSELLMYLSGKTTVFLSSHNLNIIEDLCNKVAIIKNRLLFCDKMDSIACNHTILYNLTFSNKKDSYEFINQLDTVDHSVIDDRLIVRVNEAEQQLAEKLIKEHGLVIESKKNSDRKLENLYFSVLKED